MKTSTMRAISYIAGAWRDGPSAPISIYNLANLDQEVGACSQADAAMAKEAMDEAAKAWKSWANTDVGERLKFLEQVLERLERNSERIVRTITLENGKTLRESEMEVASALRDAHYQLEAVSELEWKVPVWTPDDEVESYVRHESLGVFLLVTPWNFPLATILRKLIPALGFGNTVVCKPPERTPLTPTLLFEILDECGIPAGVANLVLGKSSVVGKPLIEHPSLAGISFTGSTEVGLEICKKVADCPVRLQMEMGGKNAAVVLEDTDLDAAVDAVVQAAFSCAGQWCTSTSRAIVQKSVYLEFTQALKERVSAIRVGDGTDPNTTMGPVFSLGQRDRVLSAVETALGEGATLLIGGSSIEEVDGKRGWYLEPIVLIDVKPEMTVAREEVFGPLLAVIEAETAEEALAIANGTEYGLSFSVFTRSDEWAERFVNEIEAGVCHVNLPTAYRSAELPVGGWRQSGRGVPECGDVQKDFYTRLKTVYRKHR
jgi:aldehyde dehydrogenase (NAD+)